MPSSVAAWPNGRWSATTKWRRTFPGACPSAVPATTAAPSAICATPPYDFYKTDPLLFAPARAVGSKLATGNTFAAGAVNAELLRPLWLSQDR
ncbi:MAG: methenyltetrahydromethanopterin cyclohydrolase [Rhodocyclaceae bacterium]